MRHSASKSAFKMTKLGLQLMQHLGGEMSAGIEEAVGKP
jgi:hypothetical protein